MATLNNPISAQEIIDRFKDFVDATANSGIVWGTDTPLPTGASESDALRLLGGDASGREAALTVSNLSSTGTISAKELMDALAAETTAYTKLRTITLQAFVSGTGGNTGTQATPGWQPPVTVKAHLKSNYVSNISSAVVANEIKGPSTGSAQAATISVSGLETAFNKLKTAYEEVMNSADPGFPAGALTPLPDDVKWQENGDSPSARPYVITVCHSSCHSSCHGSRGRR